MLKWTPLDAHFLPYQPTTRTYFEYNFLILLQNYAKAWGPSRWWSERLFQATSRNWLKKVLRMLNAWLMNAMPQKAWTKSRSTFMYPYVLKHFLKEFFLDCWNFILIRFFTARGLIYSLHVFTKNYFWILVFSFTNYNKLYLFY